MRKEMDAPLGEGKLRALAELSAIIQALRSQGKRAVLCHGVFDLLHPGHIRHLEAARREGDLLVVTITKDEFVGKGPGRPYFTQQLRAQSLAALQCVDFVAINPWPTAVETIATLQPDIYAKGSDYANLADDLTGEIVREKAAIEAIGGRIHFTEEPTFSSTKLLNTYFDVYPEEAQGFLQAFRSRYSAQDIIGRLKGLAGLKVLVVGDAIIDEYHYCEPLGKSNKEAIITTKFVSEECFAGGVLAAANHVAGFCGDVTLVTCLGTVDSREPYIRSRLRPNVRPQFFYREEVTTTVKRRFVDVSFLNKMFEVCFLDDHHLPEDADGEVCRYLAETAPSYDLVLVADFGHGFIGPNIVQVLAERARFLAINAQTNSANTGFNLITKYPRADYICIDEPEMRLANHDRFGPLEDLVVATSRRLSCPRIAVTRGHLGSLTYGEGEGFFQVPVFSRQIVDRTGAGDAYLSVTSPCVATSTPMDVVGFIGNAAAALKLQIVCNRFPVEPVPLFKFVTSLLK